MKCVRIKAVCKTQKFGGYTDERSKKQKRMGITPDASGRHCVGRILGMLAQDIPGLGWLSYGQTFGLQQPVILDLGILVLTWD